MEGAAPQTLPPTIREDDEESASVCDDGGSMIFQVKVEIPEPIERSMSSEQKTGSRRWSRQRCKTGKKLGNAR